MFIYSQYWRTWNRVLLCNFGNQFVEINLTPINANWNRVKEERIRKHCTARTSSEKPVDHLPLHVKNEMLKNLGYDLTERLLNFDYLPNVDWDKYSTVANGGAPFNQIKRDIF